MYSAIETTDIFHKITAEYEALSEKVYSHVESSDFQVGIQSQNQEVSKKNYSQGLYFVKEGQLGLAVEGTTLMYFEEGDIFSLPDSLEYSFELIVRSEFAVHYEYVDEACYTKLLSTNIDFSNNIHKLLSCYSDIFISLARSALTDQTEFSPKIVHFEVGDTILEEGDSGDLVYTMVDGKADVFVSGTLVGEIKSDEIFGALAVFSGLKRNATVKSTVRSTVLTLPKDKFIDLIKARPHTISKLIQDLADKISQLNDKVIEYSAKK